MGKERFSNGKGAPKLLSTPSVCNIQSLFKDFSFDLFHSATVLELFEGNDSVFNAFETFPSNISCKSFKTLPVQNSHCDYT